jgi:hypothetical protein
VIRAPKLVVSRPMYAFDPTTWLSGGWPTVDAVWFKRKKGVLVAVMGTYHPMVTARGHDRRPADAYEAWIAAADDNRYGGHHESSWDGTALLTTDPARIPPDLAAERTAFLTAVLAGYPHPPAGYDGWWTFPRESAT